MRRFDRSAKLKDPLRVVSCGHCQRLIDFMDCPGHPPIGTEASKLHPIFLKNPPAYAVVCTCGHYTFYVDEADRSNYEAKYLKAASAGSPAKGEPVSS